MLGPEFSKMILFYGDSCLIEIHCPHNARLHGVMCQNIIHFLTNSEGKIMNNNVLLYRLFCKILLKGLRTFVVN
jgi:hypothetical protein